MIVERKKHKPLVMTTANLRFVRDTGPRPQPPPSIKIGEPGSVVTPPAEEWSMQEPEATRVPCECGDGSCVLCDDTGMRPKD
jgi:hypothetical protein